LLGGFNEGFIMLEYTTKHPMQKDRKYHKHVIFHNDKIACRIEKLGVWPFGHVYRCVFWSKCGSWWSFEKTKFSENAAIKLKDDVFKNMHNYGFS